MYLKKLTLSPYQYMARLTAGRTRQRVDKKQGNGTHPSPAIVKVPRPKQLEIILLRLLITAGLFLVVFFVTWFLRESRAGYMPLYTMLCISLGYKLIKLLFEWYHYWSVSIPRSRKLKKRPTVDVFTTAMPGEPYSMIENTLIAIQRIRYPHTSYLCDEGDDPLLKQMCNILGVIHVTREHKINAKAGNINNALKQATGDICVILDPDHAPLPEFLDEVLPYFDDPSIGFVQVVQAYDNASSSLIAMGAAQQTYTFYGPLMMGMNTYGTVQAIGANCTFRRSALDSIGGHAAGLAEDMHTAMQLHAKGWKSVYLPKILTRGLVPANINAYYKQQLKWARGTFELLFFVFPKLFTKFSWRQVIHYSLVPLHFLTGIITLIDILIPVAALFSGEVPLYFTVNEFYEAGIPLLCIILLTRQFAQRWLLEKSEHGFHLSGGVLLFGTWWIYCIGLFYTLFRVKVPYIPTPKHKEHINNWRLQIPNIIAIALSLTAAAYGLSRDWNPYNFIIAGFAVLNATVLTVVVLASQQKILRSAKVTLWNTPRINSPFYAVKHLLQKPLPVVYGFLRNTAPVLVFLVILGSAISFRPVANETITVQQKKDGGFYTGAYIPAVQQQQLLQPAITFQKNIRTPLNIISLYEAWGPASLDQFPVSLLDSIAAAGSIPMITWEPWVHSFEPPKDWSGLQQEKKGMAAIAAGVLDEYIHAYAKKIRDYNKPVFIRFAHEAGNPAYPWSAMGLNTPEDYKAAWRKVTDVFAAEGAANVIWVWTPWLPASMDKYYPGDDIIDWIGITCLNYGSASWDGRWHSFEDIYSSFRKKLMATRKPIMLAEFGTTPYGGDANQWLAHALKQITTNYKEIRSVVFFNNPEDKNWATAWRPPGDAKGIDWSVKDPQQLAGFLPAEQQVHVVKYNNMPASSSGIVHTNAIKGEYGKMEWTVSGKPFYVKGIAYNPGHDWRDGYHPLTRKQLEKDFAAIKATGCNTIMRYHPSVYDRNIITIAGENDLKIVYGFWFDPAVDYSTDSAQVKKYYALVKNAVEEHKDKSPILAWSLGNQTLSEMKNHFAAPYLYTVQKAYRRMIESMAQYIHATDERPVMAAIECSWQLPGELMAWNKEVPSVDIIGINAAYAQQLKGLPSVMQQFGAHRPYLLTSFGAEGYWNDRYNNVDLNHGLQEKPDAKKATQYSDEWIQDIAANKGYNLGGIAFCWQDRFDGSATWSGITDFKGRKKAAYYALQQVWTGNTRGLAVPDLFMVGASYPLKPGMYYEFTALSNNSHFPHVEWHLYRDDYFQCDKYISLTGNNNKTWISLPSGEAKYRLHMYASDDYGNVVTTSIPLTTYTGVYNHDL